MRTSPRACSDLKLDNLLGSGQVALVRVMNRVAAVDIEDGNLASLQEFVARDRVLRQSLRSRSEREF